ncbi:MAG: DUF6542 domain-containing protein [Jatrophihabitantaceae bacterium]
MNAPPPYGALGSSSAGYDDGWGPATSVRAQGSSTHGSSVRGSAAPDQAVLPGRLDPHPQARTRANERGLPGWAALLVLLAIAAVGGVIDTISGAQARGGFNIGIIVASVVAILLVRRSGMFPVVIAPPIVYSVASGLMLYLRSGGLSDRKALYDGAANWLVYGFPAIAAATAAVLIIAGIRLITRR